MGRIRSIHPSACTSEKLSRASGDEERCYWRLQTHCDDEGRTEDHERLIWAAIFPLNVEVTPADVDKWLQGLHDLGLILRYEVDGKRYLAVVGWQGKQSPRHPAPSKFPQPPKSYGNPPHLDGQEREGDGGLCQGEGEGVEVRVSTRQSFEDDFDEWWAEYPRKIDKEPARKTYIARRRAGVPQVSLMAAVKNYRLGVDGRAREHVKYAKSFLNGSWTEWVDGLPESERPATLEELAQPRHTPGPWVCSAGNPECVDGFVDTPAGAKACECRA